MQTDMGATHNPVVGAVSTAAATQQNSPYHDFLHFVVRNQDRCCFTTCSEGPGPSESAGTKAGETGEATGRIIDAVQRMCRAMQPAEAGMML